MSNTAYKAISANDVPQGTVIIMTGTKTSETYSREPLPEVDVDAINAKTTERWDDYSYYNT